MSIKLSEHEPTIRRNSCLPVSLAKYATKLGGGTFSAGCRAALEYHRDNAEAVAALLVAFDSWNTWVGGGYDIAGPRFAKVLAAREALRKAAK